MLCYYIAIIIDFRDHKAYEKHRGQKTEYKNLLEQESEITSMAIGTLEPSISTLANN